MENQKGNWLVEFSLNHPKLVTGLMIVITLTMAAFAAVPSIWPEKFPSLNSIKIDTDPENMLRKDEPVRVFHDKMKKLMSIHDIVVLGIVNEDNPNGVFNVNSLKNIYELTQYAKRLDGVIEVDLIAPSTVDNIEQGGLGVVKFEWLMPVPPKTQKEAIAIRDKAKRIPFLYGTLLSEDGKAVCLYIPIRSKDLSYEIYSQLLKKIDTLEGTDKYYITGLPVAEDTFGVEMFRQMAISAPTAMIIIFLLLMYFFRKFALVISPMIVAMISAMMTMSLLVIMGKTIHIMSSMIPIFIMPIAVLDSIHILSEFFDRYQETKDRRSTAINVMNTLFTPMLYTSLTTAAGFASLALTPIPPVQVFGLFVAFGVMMAWIWTVTFIPASVMFISPKSLENYGAKTDSHEEEQSPLTILLNRVGQFTYRRAGLIMIIVAFLIVVALYGISKININDNPTRWFTKSHPIRVADYVLNKHFGGTYMAYLLLDAPKEKFNPDKYAETIIAQARQLPIAKTIAPKLKEFAKSSKTKAEFLEKCRKYAEEQSDKAPDNLFDAWSSFADIVDNEKQKTEIFKQPKALKYIETLQKELLKTGIVGKSNSVTDIVKTVHRELFLGKQKYFVIPKTPNAVAQCLITFQSGHRPNDLWHFVTPDYQKANLWVQLRSGDNKDMLAVAQDIKDFMKRNPPPFNLQHKWFGLTYINVIWQGKMVTGMLQAFLGSFLVVLLMMTLLFRSAIWGLLSMIPLTVTIGAIYGMIGLIGKDYDMPIAVLSSLSLGLAVDYAIHFLARSRMLYQIHKSWANTAGPVFGEPARAITRNVIVVGVGFLPLVLAPLVPYKTVGFFISSILITAGVGTLLILPAMITLLEKYVFPKTRPCCLICNFTTMAVAIISAVALVAVNTHQFLAIGWNILVPYSVSLIIILLIIAFIASRRDKCKLITTDENGNETQT